MCRDVRIKLSAADRQAARRLSGIVIPVYASLALMALAAVALTSGQRPGEPIAVAHGPTAASPAAAD